MQTLPKILNFSPDKALSNETLTLHAARIFPWRSKRNNRVSAAVFDQDNGICEQALVWKDDTRLRSGLPRRPNRTIRNTLRGRYLFGGIIFDHFGHVLSESLSRLWAYKESSAIDGLVFCLGNKRMDKHLAVLQLRSILEMIGVTQPIVVIDKPTIIEELVVPPQGFGLKNLSKGSPEFKAFLAAQFRASGAKIDAGLKLYISRSKYKRNGRFVCEDRLEELLFEEG